MYIRKDIIAQIWDYGAAPVVTSEVETDPYAAGIKQLLPDFVLDGATTGSGPFNEPHGIAFADDGSMYLADTKNNRILHFSSTGELLHQWGTVSASEKAEPGTFREPWGIAVAPDGSVLVTDTWNHRIQRFSATGKFITQWGYFGQAEQPDAMWGPRDVVVDDQSRVYVSDTGNKRVVVFDLDGVYITQFGTAGMERGMLDEPVGLGIDGDGNVYIADTWNQRIQVFLPDDSQMMYVAGREWDIAGWYGQSTENKPYISLDSKANVYVADPEGYRVLVYNSEGEFITGWGEYSSSLDGFDMVGGIEVAPDDSVWVVDSGNNRVMRFASPLIP